MLCESPQVFFFCKQYPVQPDEERKATALSQRSHIVGKKKKTEQSDETWRKQPGRANRPNQMFSDQQQIADVWKL